MTSRFLVSIATLIALFVLIGQSGSSAARDGGSYRPQPVTVLTLSEENFSREARLTGSVDLYRQEKVGFEVSGRLLSVLDLGKEVDGPAYNEAGGLVRRGDVIARLDDTRQRLRVQALEARLASLRKELKAQQIDVDQVAQANLAAARATLRITESDVAVAKRQIDEANAEVIRAQKDLERQKRLQESPAGREKGLDDAQAAYDTAIARQQQREAQLNSRQRARDAQVAAVSVAEATIAFKNAQVESTQGRIAELEEELNTAREDLEDTTLFAPFAGRITEVLATQGAVIRSGEPIVTLTLMDPIQVRVEVSAETERRVRTGDRAWIYPKDPTNPDRKEVQVNALVFEKGAVADPDTRTFRIDLMARNRRRRLSDVDASAKDLSAATDFLPVARRFEGEAGPLFVPTQSILRENGRTYVLRLPGVSFNGEADRSALGKHVPEKVEIKLGEDYFTVIKWSFRSLDDAADLREGEFLVVDPKPEHVSGLAIDRPQWLLRPGDLVPVRLALNNTPVGYYVPVNAISKHNGTHFIFAVIDGKARQIPVGIHETYRELRRITSNKLSPGLPIIVGGVHYVSDGQPVRVVGEEDIAK